MRARGLLAPPQDGQPPTLARVPSVTLRDPFMVFLMFVLGGLGVAAFVGGGYALSAPSMSTESRFLTAMIYFVTGILLVWWSARINLQRVTADATGVVVTHLFTRQRIAWADLRDVELRVSVNENGEGVGTNLDLNTYRGHIVAGRPLGTYPPSAEMQRHPALLLAMRDAAVRGAKAPPPRNGPATDSSTLGPRRTDRPNPRND
jgi:hypothetical protein